MHQKLSNRLKRNNVEHNEKERLSSRSSGSAFVYGAGGLRFKFLAGQIRHSVPTACPRKDISSKGAVLPGAMTRRWTSPTRIAL